MRIQWSRRARRDFVEAISYIADDNPDAAARMQDRIEEATERPARNPGMGRPGRVDGTRELVVARTPYIVPYRVRGQVVEIIAVMHGAQQWPEDFD